VLPTSEQDELVPSSVFGKDRRGHSVHREKRVSGRRFSRYLTHGAFERVVDEELLPFALMIRHTDTR
jgi:hypothetical protein